MAPDEAKPQTPQQNQPPPQQNQRPTGERRNDQRPQGGDRRDNRGPPREGRRFEGPRPKRSPEDRNTVFIGNKPPMNYVLAVVTQFNSNSDEVIIRARGKAISQAVDVAEIVRNKFFQKAAVKNVSIGTESVTGDDGRKRAISSIEIRMINTEKGATGIKPSLPQQGSPATPPVEPAPAQKSAGV